MEGYRIGRISGPWINFTPPIRGGLFHCSRKHKEAGFIDEGVGLDTESSSCSSGEEDGSIKLEINAVVAANAIIRAEHLLTQRSTRSTSGLRSSVVHDSALNLASDTHEVDLSKLTPEAYTSAIEQQEIDADIAKYPSVDPETQRRIAEKYQELHETIRAKGLYHCSYSAYVYECLRYTTIFVCFLTALHFEYYILSSMLLGLFWHQIMFTAHDAGHLGITHSFLVDTFIGMVIADLGCGLSIGWWKSSHNVHHLVTNSPEHDPDIQNVPVLATSPSFFRSLHSTYYDFDFKWDRSADFMVKIQKYSYYPIMCIARFNLYILSWHFLLKKKSPSMGARSWTRPMEILLMIGYWYWFGYRLVYLSIPTIPLRLAFVLISHIVTMPLHVQITLSHFAASTADLGESESFAQKQLRTTMDVDCPPWLDFIHGGLQFQAVHHLFPRIPRHNLRETQTLVMRFCHQVGIEYRILGFLEGNQKVLSRLGQVSKQLEILLECQKHMAQTGESGLH